MRRHITHKKENLKTDLAIRKKKYYFNLYLFSYILNKRYLSNIIKIFMVTLH